MLCSVVSGYRGKHYPSSRECWLPRTVPVASLGSTHPPPMLRREGTHSNATASAPKPLSVGRPAYSPVTPPKTPPAQHAASLVGGEGSSPEVPVGSVPAELPQARLGLPGAAEAHFSARNSIAAATTPHRNQVYLFNLKEKKRFSCNNSQTELLVDY